VELATPQWPDFFVYQQAELDVYERQFLQNSGILIGAFKHIHDDDKISLCSHCIQ